MDLIVKTENLTKVYGQKTAVNSVNMHIERGDIYGFIGKNGAGKTTTMKMLLGTSYPNRGSIELFGSRNLIAGRKKIGSLVESPALYKNCTAYENMKRMAMISGGSSKQIKEILELVGLDKVGRKKVSAFSFGMKQRLGIGLSLLGNPELLILDEPINGLDPGGIKEIRDIILNLNKEKQITILVSSHILDELAKITTRYGIINNGSLTEEITASELESRCSKRLAIITNDPETSLTIIKDRFNGIQADIKDGIVNVYSPTDSAAINQILTNSGIFVCEITYIQDSFEEYFIRRIG
jgi:ABC-2 type transport system ATP-binding protein